MNSVYASEIDYLPVDESFVIENTIPDYDASKTTVGQVIFQCAPAWTGLPRRISRGSPYISDWKNDLNLNFNVYD